MQWLVVYHTRLETTWRENRREWLKVVTWIVLLILVYLTRRPVVYAWDALPWAIIGSVIIYFGAVMAPFFTCTRTLGDWTNFPQMAREAIVPECAASHVASLPASTWETRGAPATQTVEITQAERILVCAMGEHLAKASDYESLLTQLWDYQGLDSKERNSRLGMIKTYKDGSFGADALLHRLLERD